jgi:glycosyltransferase involved in cell wall biosynthesis
MVVSLHIVPDKDFQPRTLLGKINANALRRVERPALRSADHFIAVYNPIVPYLQRNKVQEYSVIYNAVGYTAVPKQSYDLHRPTRLLTVGNQLRDHKDPTHILEAACELRNVELKLIGTGNVHQQLMTLARELKCEARCEFIPALKNEQVLAEMQQADIYVFNQSMLGISKTVMEATLTGLPIIVNKRPGGARDELNADWLLQVEDTKDGYSRGIRELTENNTKRERLGHAAYDHAHKNWDPHDLEQKAARLYQRILERSQSQLLP